MNRIKKKIKRNINIQLFFEYQIYQAYLERKINAVQGKASVVNTKWRKDHNGFWTSDFSVTGQRPTTNDPYAHKNA